MRAVPNALMANQKSLSYYFIVPRVCPDFSFEIQTTLPTPHTQKKEQKMFRYKYIYRPIMNRCYSGDGGGCGGAGGVGVGETKSAFDLYRTLR